MAKKTTSKTSLKNWSDVDEQLRIIAVKDAFIAKKEAEMNAAILKVQKQFEQETADARASKVAAEKEIELFCHEHRDEFVDSKTKVLNYGLVAFRLSTPKLNVLKGFTWDSVIKLLKKFKMEDFIRVKEEVDRDAVKAKITEPKDLAAIGLAITQSENFYYETFKLEIETV
jgi:phage host-nuclease inhibitor protein Gam